MNFSSQLECTVSSQGEEADHWVGIKTHRRK